MDSKITPINSRSKVTLINGSSAYGTVTDYSWIESERSFYGKLDETGEYFYFWDVSVEGYSSSFRRSCE